ncbi:MAG TPA: amidohydrolase family protein [Jiangellales bacterium]|nr:amidohydrolase family protein [Jiangellales bacterium]
MDLLNRWHALGGGLFVGWGPTRTGTNVGPAYRTVLDHGIRVGYHADGGDITVINPRLNFYTMTTGRNLAGAHILGDQMISRQEVLWLATVANKWSIGEDDLGSIEVGNHADLVVLDRDYFAVPDEEIKQIRPDARRRNGRSRLRRTRLIPSPGQAARLIPGWARPTGAPSRRHALGRTRCMFDD